MAVADFVLSLRAKVGHDLLWLPGVSAVVLNDAGEILLGQRADFGYWSIISGMPDPGEEPAAAIVREVFEETGVDVVPERISSVTVTPEVVYPNGDACTYLNVTFRCRAVGGEARVNDDESLAVGWFARDRLPPLGPMARSRIEHALAPDGPAFFVGS
jgi:8-oxo-dGTP pyrophosphatase MutT (NUDIX family)